MKNQICTPIPLKENTLVENSLITIAKTLGLHVKAILGNESEQTTIPLRNGRGILALEKSCYNMICPAVKNKTRYVYSNGLLKNIAYCVL